MAFLDDYREWLDKGCPDGKPFLRRHALCDAAFESGVQLNERLVMRQAWINLNMDPNFPFNKDSTAFYKECDQGKCYLNQERKAFVYIMTTRKEQSAELTEFYTVMQQWLDEGCPEGQPFTRQKSIGLNLVHVLGENEITTQLLDEMQLQFVHAGRNVLFPFNACDKDRLNEMEIGVTYDNLARTNWIKEHAQQSEEQTD